MAKKPYKNYFNFLKFFSHDHKNGTVERQQNAQKIYIQNFRGNKHSFRLRRVKKRR